MISPLDRLSYIARQGARVAWYMAHYFAAQDLRGEGETPPPQPARDGAASKASPSWSLFSELAALFRQDLENVAAGHYPYPRDHDGGFADVMRSSREFFSDAPRAAERKALGGSDEVYSPALAADFPDYFLQNFHYQTGGYLTEDSARLYDTQVEILFSGSANAMRRQCLVPLSQFLHGRDQRSYRLLDVGCGTGRLMRFVKEAFPRLNLAGLDLSPAYVAEARRHLAPYQATFEAANAEAMPFPGESFDLLTTVYLFHEVPPPVRRTIAREFARLLKPGGRLIFMDSLQLGDRPQLDRLLNSFPKNFHEPYFQGYLTENLRSMFEEAGLRFISSDNFFLSKRMVWDKPTSLP
jgi:ubiquinone/menaquinone biosynthesis C-methylase UbiE